MPSLDGSSDWARQLTLLNVPGVKLTSPSIVQSAIHSSMCVGQNAGSVF